MSEGDGEERPRPRGGRGEMGVLSIVDRGTSSCLNGLLRLLVGGDEGIVDPTASMTPMMPTSPGAPDPAKAHKAEADDVRFAESVYR
ncbi:hypothetical protein BD626DRAFT_570515 [Schizophyllum amplum]|uniref:Uncharacterized protein n=1 Tax=Schizophyllum amplum TaxID=97359 RepID=A0A550CAI5_9AGAR|nr:hypothetical protein BD626DRAFT_570515 [Auriculariopsis ampla]